MSKVKRQDEIRRELIREREEAVLAIVKEYSMNPFVLFMDLPWKEKVLAVLAVFIALTFMSPLLALLGWIIF